MRISVLSVIFPAALLCFVTRSSAQLTAYHSWSELQTKNPPGLDFTIRMLDLAEYREGELIRLEVKIPGRLHTLAQPPQEQWQFAGFLLDPQKPCGPRQPGCVCGSVQSPCVMAIGFSIDKSDPMFRFGTSPEPLMFFLNNYVPPLPPGTYRTAALARKLVLTGRAPMSATYGYANPDQYAVSNAIDFEVLPASNAWIAERVAANAAILRQAQTGSNQEYERRREAAHQLRFLDTPTVWRTCLDLLPIEEFTLLRGLAATREPAKVCELMQSRVPQPSQSVSSHYLSVLGQVCAHAHLPPPPRSPGIAPGQTDPVLMNYSKKTLAYQEDLLGKAAAQLAASLPRKEGEVKAIALETLMSRLQNRLYNQPDAPEPAWVPLLRREFASTLQTLQSWRKRHLLEMYAGTLRSPEMAPALEAVLDAWKPGDNYQAPDAAIRALHQLDPARAHARILAELRKPRTWLRTEALELLPREVVRPIDDELIEALAAAQREGGWNPNLSMTALAKYATPKALPRIKAIYESQQEPCQPELMAYFVRVDPAYADRVFRSHPWVMHAPAPPCTVQYFERTPRIAMHGVLEKYMTAYLMHGSVPVKKTAAHSLGLYGSPAALPALWGAFRYFHNYWNGKGVELAKNLEGVDLEVELRNAIARGRNWLTQAADLRTLESLCISEPCRRDALQDVQAWHAPVRVEISDRQSGIHGAVAQYYGLDGLDAIKVKLSQFPRGTQFVFTAHGPNAKQAAETVREYAAGRGYVITEPLPAGSAATRR